MKMMYDIIYFVGPVVPEARIYHTIVDETTYRTMRDDPNIHFTNVKRAE